MVVVVLVVVVALSAPNQAQAAQPLIVLLVAAVVSQTTAVVALVAVVVVVEEVLKLQLIEISPVTNKFIKLAIEFEKRHVKNIAIGEGGNEMKEMINGRMKEHLGLNEASLLINTI